MNKFIINSSSLLLYILPLALLTGPFLPDLFISLIGILVTILIIKGREYQYLKNKFFIFFLIFYFYLLVRSLFAESIILSLESSLFYFRFGLFAVCVWYLIDNNEKIIKHFSIFLLATFIFALVDGYYQYFNDIGIFGFSWPDARLSLPLNNKAILGGYLARLFPLLLAVLIYSFDLKKFYILLILFILMLTDVLIFISGERTALALLFLATLFIIVFLSKYKKIRFFTFLISVFLMIFISNSNPIIKERVIDRTFNQVTGDGSGDIKLFSNQHQIWILESWKMFKANPVFGQGPKMFRTLCDDKRFIVTNNDNNNVCSTHPHNNYAQLMAETGIIGLTIILIFYFKIIKLIFEHMTLFISKRKYLLSDFQICLIASLMLTFWPLVPSQNFFNNWINVIYYLPVGFLLYSLHNKKNFKPI